MTLRLLPILLLAACGGPRPPQAPSAEEPAASAAQPSAAPEARPVAQDRWSGRVVVIGHAAARFQFPIPAGLAPLRGVTPPADPKEQLELANQGADGVGIPNGATIALSSIVLFSDPAGLGVAFESLDPAGRERLAARYLEAVQTAMPDAKEVHVLQVGSHLALQIDLPRVEIPGRPLRQGRHYLVFDGTATASVDCLWIESDAARMVTACDQVAATMKRVSSAAP
jgi:hypothetical protein